MKHSRGCQLSCGAEAGVSLMWQNNPMFNVIGNSPKRKMDGFNSEMNTALVLKKLNHREVEVTLTTARK